MSSQRAPAEATVAAGHGHSGLEATWSIFAITWALAVLFHLAGNSALAPWWAKAILGASAVAVLALPRSRLAIAAMSSAVLVNVWVEAPVLGNHWLLNGFVAAVVLGALVGAKASPGEAMARMRGPLRLLLLAFYSFAAFAKVNHDFLFEPSVSCGAQFLRESATSWGLGSLVEGLGREADVAVAIAVAGIELSVAVLLAFRSTRHAGVLLGLGFHFVVALNRDHQFFDFSAVLLALFLLFLEPAAAERVLTLVRSTSERMRARWPSGPELLRTGGLVLASLIAVASAGSEQLDTRWVAHDAGLLLWLGYGLVTLVVVARATSRRSASTEPLVGPGVRRPLLLLPLVAVINGVTPYVELKTSASWNMYSNLAVVDGDSNHLLVRRGLPLTDAYERLVEVVEADGVDLSFYVGPAWRLPEVMLEDHLADRPAAVVTGRVDGRAVRYEGGRGGARPTWQQKFQVFRAVDADGPVSCQPSFGPAR